MKTTLATIAVALLSVATPAVAEYPEQPVTVIVPNRAGGGLDLVVRLVSTELSEVLGQSVVVQNMPGAGTAIGSREAHGADPDGYTVLVNHEAILTLSAMGRLGFDITDLEPVAMTGGFANALAARADAPYTSFEELCAFAAENLGEVSAAVQIGALSHFHVISAANSCDMDLNYVNLTGGGAEFRAALLGSTIDLAPMPAGGAANLLASGDIQVLAFLGPERHPSLPDTPTPQELGFEQAEGDFNFYWWVSADTPDEIKATLSNALSAAFEQVIASGRLDELGMAAPRFLSGADVRAQIEDRISSTSAMAEAAGLAAN